MAVTFTGNLLVKFQGNLVDADTMSSPADELGLAVAKAIASGTGTDQANEVYRGERTLGASAAESLDVSGTSLVNSFGDSIALAKVKAVIVVADLANTNDVQVTRPASNGVPTFMAAGDGVALGPGGILVLYFPTGVTVTAATADLITFTNSAGSTSVTYKLIIVGNR